LASAAKLVEKMQNQPSGIRMEEADKVLRHSGYRLGRQKGSHRHYINVDGDVLTIAERKPTIKPFYVREILARIS
jgi:predicted RNA binding protein YcfA (HicA-like mRNA interferase family)